MAKQRYYLVRSCGYNSRTLEPTTFNALQKNFVFPNITIRTNKEANYREEIIDTETNELFQGCKTPKQLRSAFETFWNGHNSTKDEIVVVMCVLPFDPPVQAKK